MKLKFSILTIILTLTACSAPQAEQKAVALDTEIKKGSYYAGFDMVERMVGQFSGALDEDAFLAGVTDRQAAKSSQVTEAEIEAAVNALV